MEVIIGSDHGGYKLKEFLKTHLSSIGHTVIDTGASFMDPQDDYPEIVEPAMKELQKNPQGKAILICRNGVGVTIVANKFKGVRAGLSWSKDHAKSSRNDDDTNVLTLGADYLSMQEAVDIVDTWINTPFEANERRTRRLDELNRIENE